MTIEQSDYLNVGEQLDKLGLKSPQTMALLPARFAHAESLDECEHLANAITIKKVLRTAELPLEEIVEKDQRLSFIQNNSVELVLPSIFFTYSAINGDLGMLYETTQAIVSYITRAFPDPTKENTVKVSYVVEINEHGKCKKFQYEGSVDGLVQLPEVLKSVDDE